jgi:transcriptional regulator with XRE-family HTH domain
MSFGDISARLKKKKAEEEAVAAPPRDFEELHTLRARILGVLLQDARRSKGRTEQQCAAEIGVPLEYYTEMELGERAPSLPQLEILAYFIGVPISHFWNTTTVGTETSGVAKEDFSDLRDRVIGAMIRAKRQALGMSAADLAEACGLTEQHIEAYELAQHPIPFTELTTLASALKVSVSYFMDDSSRVGDWLSAQEDYRKFAELPAELREWVMQPSHAPFIEIAMKLSKLPVKELRDVGENILNITF